MAKKIVFMHSNEAVTKNRPTVICQEFSKAICAITLKFDV